jgi:hypothetical protein
MDSRLARLPLQTDCRQTNDIIELETARPRCRLAATSLRERIERSNDGSQALRIPWLSWAFEIETFSKKDGKNELSDIDDKNDYAPDYGVT